MYRFRFTMQKGPTPGATMDISQPQMLIGRDPACDIVISDAEVSRRHARVLVSGDTCILEDLGSTNGTFVNGRRISAPYELKNGDTIMMGENVIVVFELQSFDPNATVISRPVAQVEEMPPQAPPTAMPSNGGFAGQIPAQPAAAPPPPVAAPPVAGGAEPPAPKRKLTPWLLAGGGLLTFLCLCATFLIWVDMTSRWCQFFPFLAGCS